MSPSSSTHTELDESEAETLARPSTELSAVEVRPPRNEDLPASVDSFIRGILETQTSLLGFKNTSPVTVYEIHRFQSDRLRVQFCVPSTRLERKVRTQLSTDVAGVGFDSGTLTLPLAQGDSIGGGIVTTGRPDRYPLETEFDAPPVNSIVAGLHRHAMTGTGFLIQIVFQPVAGHSLTEGWRKHRGSKTVAFLRKEKEELWGDREATPRERHQADAVERKLGQRRFWVSIRFAVLGAADSTPSRIKELGGAFNIFENPESGQYLDINTITGRRKHHIRFLRAVSDRTFGGYSLRFQATVPELVALVSIPDREQQNLKMASP